MNFLGPELVWLLLYGATTLLGHRNQPPTEAGSRQLETIGWFLPLIGVALSFVPLWWAAGNKWIWLLRIGVAGLVGVVAVTTKLCGAIDYGDSRNSGVGSAYLIFIMLGVMALFAGSAIAALTFIFRHVK